MGFMLPSFWSRFKLVEPLKNPRFGASGHFRHLIALIVERQIVKIFFAFNVKPSEAVANNDGDFVGKTGIISEQRRNGAGQDLAMAVLMLDPLSIPSRTPGRAIQEQPLRYNHAPRPQQLSDAPKPTHRIIEVEGHNVDTVVGIGRAGGNKG